MTQKVRRVLLVLFVTSFTLGIVLAAYRIVGGSGNNGGALLAVGKKVGLVKLEGLIKDSESMVKALKKLRENNSVPAVVLRVNTPGGGVAASQEIYEEVRQFKVAEKPLVVSMATIAASGGYYVSCPAHTIFANPGTLTGSIGVIFDLPYAEGLLKRIGVGFQVIKSGKFKDTGIISRRLTPLEKHLLQGVVDDSFNQFLEAIEQERNISHKELLRIADGRILTGRQAKTHNLVDTLGTLEDAIAFAAELGGIKGKPKVYHVRKPRPGKWRNLLLGCLEWILSSELTPNPYKAPLRYQLQ